MKTHLGKETSKAIKNFPFPMEKVSIDLVYALVKVKQAAARANRQSGKMSEDIQQAIDYACNELLDGKHNHFPLPALQGGAGTSINMNVNEVIASVASLKLSRSESEHFIHPNDHVNQSQSTNDVVPSATRLVCYEKGNKLIKTMQHLVATFEKKAKEFAHIKKLGRTHIQDAVPTTLGEEMAAYAFIARRDLQRIESIIPVFLELNLGGTAVGNGINAPKEYRTYVYQHLNSITGYSFTPAENLMALTSSTGDFCHFHGALFSYVTNISKIAKDFRVLSSGPSGGVGEIRLRELQSGSSIMPGKVNPIMPEAVNQLFYLVSGNHQTVHLSTHGANLELAVMFPVLAYSLLQSLELTISVTTQFADLCVATLEANEEQCKRNLENSTAYATLLCPKLGYDVVSKAVKRSITEGKPLRNVMVDNNIVTEKEFDEMVSMDTSE